MDAGFGMTVISDEIDAVVIIVSAIDVFGFVFRFDSAQTIRARKSHWFRESAATETRTREFDWGGKTAVASAVDVVVESLDG